MNAAVAKLFLFPIILVDCLALCCSELCSLKFWWCHLHTIFHICYKVISLSQVIFNQNLSFFDSTREKQAHRKTISHIVARNTFYSKKVHRNTATYCCKYFCRNTTTSRSKKVCRTTTTYYCKKFWVHWQEPVMSLLTG